VDGRVNTFFFPSFFFLFLMGFVTGTLSPKTMKENRLISKKKKKKKKKGRKKRNKKTILFRLRSL